MIVFKYRVTGERGVRYLAMLGDVYAANLYDEVQHHRSPIPEEVLISYMMEAIRNKMEDVLISGLKVVTEYDKLAIRSQVMKPIDVSVFELGKFENERYAESVINDYRNDPLKLHEDRRPERGYHI